MVFFKYVSITADVIDSIVLLISPFRILGSKKYVKAFVQSPESAGDISRTLVSGMDQNSFWGEASELVT
mgnify:CR=1 FL=1